MGVILVLLFMGFYYQMGGIVANVMVLFNLLYLLALLAVLLSIDSALRFRIASLGSGPLLCGARVDNETESAITLGTIDLE